MIQRSESISTPRLDTALDAWLERKKPWVKESTYAKYFNLISKHIKPNLGNLPLETISNTIISTYISEKVFPNGHESTGLSIKTMRSIMSIIKSVLFFTKSEGMLRDISHLNFTLPREKPKTMRVFTKDEQAVFEKYLCVEEDVSKLGILLCLYTGLRVGEICSLFWSDFALDKGTLTVCRTIQRVQVPGGDCQSKTKVLLTAPKSVCSTRVIPLPQKIVEKLKRIKPACDDTFFLTGDPRRYIEPRTYQNRFKHYITCCGIKDANFHTTRHTFATRCVEHGFEIKSLSEILGHANVNITLNRYVHPSLDLKRSNMDKLAFLH